MGKSLLFVTIIEDNIHYLEATDKTAGIFPGTPELATSNESLQTVARRAGEIYLSADLHNTLNEWQTFPKVKDTHLQGLTQRAAAEKDTTASPLEVRYKAVKDVVEDGSTKKLVNYVAVSRPAIASLREHFGKYAKKIKQITTLPLSLAALVCQTHKPKQDFFMVWVGKESTIIAIVTSDGLIRLSRTVPISLASENNTLTPTGFSEAINRELAMTSTFCRQKLRIDPPKVGYFFGNEMLEGILKEHPLEAQELEVVFGLAPFSSSGVTASFANENAHLLCNSCKVPLFSFIPQEETIARQTAFLTRISTVFLTTAVIVTALWTIQIFETKQERLSTYRTKIDDINQLRNEIEDKKKTLSQYNPILARESFYRKSFTNLPPWEDLLDDLAVLVPPEIKITDYQLVPMGTSWQNKLSGQLREDDWQTGLAKLRQFGLKLDTSTRFRVKSTDYNFGELTSDPKIYHFNMDLTLLPGSDL